MEIPIYKDLKSFLENYENDFFRNYASQNITYFQYLTDLQDLYNNYYEKLKYKHDVNYGNILNIDSNTKTAFALLQTETDQNEIKNLSEQIQMGKSFLSQHEALHFKTEPELRELTAIIEKIKTDVIIQKDRLKTPFYNGQVQSPPPETFEIPELDFSDNSDKVKLIMLEKLGIIEYIKTIQTKPNTISHTSEILSAITGIETKTLNTYLYPMLRPYRDDDDKNSPYKNPENLEKAERELIKLKIKNINANR